MFETIWNYLERILGFLTDHLVDVGEGWDQKMYLGLCKLPGDNYKWVRGFSILSGPGMGVRLEWE